MARMAARIFRRSPSAVTRSVSKPPAAIAAMSPPRSPEKVEAGVVAVAVGEDWVEPLGAALGVAAAGTAVGVFTTGVWTDGAVASGGRAGGSANWKALISAVVAC